MQAPLGRICRILAMSAVLGSLWGCGWIHAPVLDPKGPIALAERDLLLTAFGLMLIVLVPVYVLTIWIVRTYRAEAASDKAGYMPDWSYSIWIDVVIWVVPAVIVAMLGYLVWAKTHTLDPYRAISAGQPPLEVQVVAQDWKWLFIYPEQGVASVNELVFPVGRPLSLRLTSDTVMNSFYIPGLGGQIYAMAGMESRLNLLADETAAIRGRNTQYSGRGFADQHFAVRIVPDQDFVGWIAQVRQSSRQLDRLTYDTLAKPSAKVPVSYYSNVAPDLFAAVIAKYAGQAGHRNHAATSDPQGAK